MYIRMYVGFNFIYTDINARVQEIKFFLASQVWSQAVGGARTSGTPNVLVPVCKPGIS